jgi:hydrogenase maturation protease
LKEISKKTLIVGLGNSLNGDDGFGARVVELLRRNGTESPPAVSLVDAHTDLLNHLESFAAYDLVILIDAVLDPECKLGRPGRIAVQDEASFESWSAVSTGIHQMSPLLSVRLFRTLHPEATTQIILIALFADQITHASHYLTDKRIAEAAAAVLSLLQKAT